MEFRKFSAHTQNLHTYPANCFLSQVSQILYGVSYVSDISGVSYVSYVSDVSGVSYVSCLIGIMCLRCLYVSYQFFLSSPAPYETSETPETFEKSQTFLPPKLLMDNRHESPINFYNLYSSGIILTMMYFFFQAWAAQLYRRTTPVERDLDSSSMYRCGSRFCVTP